MANPTCVALNKCEIKEIFDKNLKAAVFKQIKQTVKTLVDKTKGLTFDDNCKDGWLLSATVNSLQVDDVNKPTTIEAKVFIQGVRANFTGLNATGASKATGISAKKLEQEATAIVNDAVGDLMTKKVIPQMLKP